MNKILSYGALFLFLFVIEEATLTANPVYGMILNPIPSVLFALFLLESPLFSVWFGFSCGILLDVTSGFGNYFYAILLTAFSYLFGSLLSKLFRPNISSAMLGALAGPFCIETIHYLIWKISSEICNYSYVSHVLPQVFFSFLLSVPAVCLLYVMNRKFRQIYPN